MADGGEDRNSLVPVFKAAAGSERLKGALRWLVIAAWSAGVVPAFHWLTTRYDTTSAAVMQKQVNSIESQVGLPPEGVTESSLRARVVVFEAGSALAEQRQLAHDYALLSRVLVAVRSAGERGARRRELARDAMREFDDKCDCRGKVGDALDPYRCKVDPAAAFSKALGD